ncbi:MAG TPA: fatty acid cis/trans isomerase [Candidatus Kapabacteria bacterium]|nr:fatty acid cis/trans isomerase [Candidatus Kapabacteria bacterium]
MRQPVILLLILLATGCASLVINDYDQRFGAANPARFDQPLATGSTDYWRDVKPVLEQRCVVCHACYDAPCQLKLGSFEGIARGAHTDKVYDGERLLAARTTRLFEDAQSTAGWRELGFFPVLNERRNDPEANLAGSTLAQMLQLKQDHPLPDQPILPDSFDLALDRNQQCVKVEQFEDFRRDYPLWGMPYGLPALPAKERKLLLQWVQEGAPYRAPAPIAPVLERHIQAWERFLNQDSPKAQLMSRYLYEHLYLGHLYFEDGAPPRYFELVRSATAPGQPVQRIATRRPYDDPGVARVYYRILPVREAIVAKTHMPYRLSPTRLQRWQALFLTPAYDVAELPPYDVETASNPFITFRQLPAGARYRFLLEEAQYTVMNFIKGPVCRGQMALNVINDHSWVLFVNPDLPSLDVYADAMAEQLARTSLPGEADSNATPFRWMLYADEEKKFLKAKSDFLNQHVKDRIPLDLNLLWHGDGNNQNAALTIFRHSDSASVVKGLQGDQPQTAWVLTYPLLERIHYLLVAGYDVYGNVGHQLNSRIYMDFLRMEGEFNFLALLPQAQREKVRAQWYRGSVNEVKEYVYQHGNRFDGETGIQYQTDQPLPELYQRIRQTLDPVLDTQYALENGITDPATLQSLRQIQQIRGTSAAILPQTLVIAIASDRQKKTHYYTLLHHNAYSNISNIFGEEDRRLPDEDQMWLANGLIGAYPSAFLQLDQDEVPELVQHLRTLGNENDYRALLDKFGVRRTDPRFWRFSDNLHQAYRKQAPIEAGWLDYNRLENR